MKYILIDLPNSKPNQNLIINSPERVIFDDGSEGRAFICEKCFKPFKIDTTEHLEGCKMEWPVNAKNFEILPNFKLFKMSEEYGIMQEKIIKAITNLSNFSKLEQGIDNPIVNVGLLGKYYSTYGNMSRFHCYVLFHYKNIVGYCLIQEYISLNFDRLKIIIRDIYFLPNYRSKGFASSFLYLIAREYKRDISEIIFSLPVSDKLKGVLKNKFNLQEIRGIDGEDFGSLRLCFL